MSAKAQPRIAATAEHGQQKTDHTFTFDLRWPSGASIRRYENDTDLDVERFTQDMDEGLIDGIPRAKKDEDTGVWLEMYPLLHGTVMMECGRKLSEYAIPQSATLTVVLATLETRH